MGGISECIKEKGEMQMKQRYLGRRIISIVLTIAMVFSLLSINSMPVRAEGNDPPSGTEGTETPGLAPTIKTQPQSINLEPGYTAGSVSVEPDTTIQGVTLSYQWYSNTTKSNYEGSVIDGATDLTYNIPTGLEAKKYYYYCVVTATDTEGATDSTVSEVATVTVLGKTATGVSITNDVSTVINGANVTLDWDSTNQYYAVVSPDDADDKTVVWKSSNNNVATVSSDGVVAPIGVGTATITAIATNGTVKEDYTGYPSASFTVNVDPYVVLVPNFSYTGSSEKLISEASMNCWYRVATTGNAGTWVKYLDYADLSNSALTAKNVGEYSVFYYYGNTDPTSGIEGTPVGKVKITKANVTIKADDITRAYGETDPALTATITGAKGNDALDYGISREPGNNVGTYTITVTKGTGAVNSNYNITCTNGTFTITKAGQPTVVAPTVGADSTYNGQVRQLLTDNGSTNDGTMYYAVGDSETIAPTTGWSTTAPSKKDAGEYYVWFKVTGKNHEDVLPTYVGKVTIAKKSIAVSAVAKTITYGESITPLEYTYTVTDLIDGDKFTGALACEGADKAGSYEITIGTLSAGDNYTINYTKAYLTINKKTSSVTTAPAAIPNLVYDKKAYALVSEGVAVNGELQYALGESATTAPEDSETATVWSTTIPTGTDAGTYYVWYRVYGGDNNTGVDPICIPVVIAKKSINVTVDAKEKVYGTTDPELTYTSDALVEGDTFTGKLACTKEEKVGEYDITQGTLTAGENYEIAFTGAKFKITIRDYVVETAPVANDLTYSGTAQALVNADAAVVDDKLNDVVKDTGKLEYILGENAETAPAETETLKWSETVPTGTNAGTYYVWYRAKADDNHNGTTPVCITVEIKKATITYTVSGYEAKYDGAAHTGTVTVTAPTDATVKYMIENGVWTDEAPTFKDVCDKVVSVKITADNYI